MLLVHVYEKNACQNNAYKLPVRTHCTDKFKNIYNKSPVLKPAALKTLLSIPRLTNGVNMKVI
jgi:hypothetical protein